MRVEQEVRAQGLELAIGILEYIFPSWFHKDHPIWEFPKIKGTILGVPIIRTIVFWGLYWDPSI